MRPARLILVLAACLACLPAADALAGDPPDLFVDQASLGGRCADSRPADRVTRATPWCSLDRALRAAPDGATVYVRRASYPRVTVTGARHSEDIVFTPYRDESPRINGLTLTTVDHVRFRGLTFTYGIVATAVSDLRFVGNEFALVPVGARTSSGLILRSARRILVAGNHFHDGRDGVALNSALLPNHDVQIVGNRFERMGADGVQMQPGSEDVTVLGNRFEDVYQRADMDINEHSDAVQVLGPTDNVELRANRVSGRGRGFMIMLPPELFDTPGLGNFHMTIANNAFSGYDFGIRAFSIPGAVIVNNTSWGTQTGYGTGIDLRDHVGSNAASEGVVFVNNTMRELYVDPTLTFARDDHNVVGGDPGLDADLRPLAGSPLLDAGDAGEAPADDLLGDPRGDRPDIGAYEGVTSRRSARRALHRWARLARRG